MYTHVGSGGRDKEGAGREDKLGSHKVVAFNTRTVAVTNSRGHCLNRLKLMVNKQPRPRMRYDQKQMSERIPNASLPLFSLQTVGVFWCARFPTKEVLGWQP